MRPVNLRRGKGSLSRNFAPIVVFPGRSGVMTPDRGSLLIMQLGLRSLQGPGKFPFRSRLAHVNLRARCVSLQNNFLFSGRRLNFIWHIVRRRDRLPIGLSGHSDQNGDLQQSCNHRRSLPSPGGKARRRQSPLLPLNPSNAYSAFSTKQLLPI